MMKKTKNEKGIGFLPLCGAILLTVISAAILSGQENAKTNADLNADLYKEFQPEKSSRVRENIEWSIIYMFGTNDESKPRALLIGDSICNGYQSVVCRQLEDKMNVTYWAGSKCATDPAYFRELDLMLSSNHYDAVTFNNGLHSLGSDRAEWENAYRAAVKFIRAKLPDAKLFIVTNTPMENPGDSVKSKELGEIAKKVAADHGLPVIDLYSVTETLGTKDLWRDGVHFNAPAVELQGKTVADALTKAVGISTDEKD